MTQLQQTARWLIVSVAGVIVAWVGYHGLMLFRNISDTLSDSGYYRFDREHNLPHGYDRRMNKSLHYLRDTTLFYCQNHKGLFPPMQDALQTQRALLALRPNTPICFIIRPRICGSSRTRLLQGRRYGDIIHPDDVVAFYDPQPPSTYPKVYYVMLSGRIGHVDVKDWPKLIIKIAR